MDGGMTKDDLYINLRALLAPAEVTVFDFPVAKQWGIVIRIGRKQVARRFDKSDSSLPLLLEEIGMNLKGTENGENKGRR